MPDGDRVVLEVDGIPFQADGLASAQTIKRSEKDGDFKLTPFCGFKEFLDFGTIVKAADKLSAYIKCIEEEKAGNAEFKSAKQTIAKAITELHCEEADIFVKEFLPAYELTLDELN